jgi:hypothetical protein
MQIVKGIVVDGKVLLEQGALPDGAEVAVFVTRQDALVRLPPALQRELEDALADADREPGICAEELLTELRKYG